MNRSRSTAGLPGLRDEGLLQSALHRPLDLFTYGQPDLATLAAAYAVGLAGNHPFLDGNERTSFVVCLTFLLLNGFDLIEEDGPCVTIWLFLAEGIIGDDDLEAWIRQRLRPSATAAD